MPVEWQCLNKWIFYISLDIGQNFYVGLRTHIFKCIEKYLPDALHNAHRKQKMKRKKIQRHRMKSLKNSYWYCCCFEHLIRTNRNINKIDVENIFGRAQQKNNGKKKALRWWTRIDKWNRPLFKQMRYVFFYSCVLSLGPSVAPSILPLFCGQTAFFPWALQFL